MGCRAGSTPAANRPHTGATSQPWADGREEQGVHPLQEAEHTSSSPCYRGRGRSAQQEHVPILANRASCSGPQARCTGALWGGGWSPLGWWETWSTSLRGRACAEKPEACEVKHIFVVWHQLFPTTVGEQAPCAFQSPFPLHVASQWQY